MVGRRVNLISDRRSLRVVTGRTQFGQTGQIVITGVLTRITIRVQNVVRINRQTRGRINIHGRTPDSTSDSDTSVAVAYCYVTGLVIHTAHNIQGGYCTDASDTQVCIPGRAAVVVQRNVDIRTARTGCFDLSAVEIYATGRQRVERVTHCHRSIVLKYVYVFDFKRHRQLRDHVEIGNGSTLQHIRIKGAVIRRCPIRSDNHAADTAVNAGHIDQQYIQIALDDLHRARCTGVDHVTVVIDVFNKAIALERAVNLVNLSLISGHRLGIR